VWVVYILQCIDETLYTGITNNLEKRIKQHNSNKGSKYTRGRGPVKLVFSISVDDKSQAAKEEYRIKKLTKEKKLELIKNKNLFS
jgi:putative endonuclease